MAVPFLSRNVRLVLFGGVLVFRSLIAADGACAQEQPGISPPGLRVLEQSWMKVNPLPRGWDRPIYSSSDRVPEEIRRRPSIRSRRSEFQYRVKIHNDGPKTIVGFSWEYVVSDPSNNKELSRHSFWTEKKVTARKTKDLEGTSTSPPSNVVSVEGLKKDSRSPFLERIVFKCVRYADGTFWTGPSATELDCEIPAKVQNRRNPVGEQ